jgi:hypothetical protein
MAASSRCLPDPDHLLTPRVVDEFAVLESSAGSDQRDEVGCVQFDVSAISS